MQPDYESDLELYNSLSFEVDRHETPQAAALGELLYETIIPKSVIDIGCSSGIYLLPYLDNGCSVLGIDGASKANLHLLPSSFRCVDLREPWTPPTKFDLALCIEVLEHIPEKYADLVVETICKCSDILFISAARKGQQGEGHLNCQDKPYWIEKFGKHGYEVSHVSAKIEQVIMSDPVYNHCGWLKSNAVLLQKRLT
jgi:SAM-dependent methyltransferase